MGIALKSRSIIVRADHFFARKTALKIVTPIFPKNNRRDLFYRNLPQIFSFGISDVKVLFFSRHTFNIIMGKISVLNNVSFYKLSNSVPYRINKL